LLGFFPDLLSGSQLFFCNHPASAAIARALFNAIKVHPRASEHGHAPVGSGTATPKNRRATEIESPLANMQRFFRTGSYFQI
jgi:hypothetical protein